MSGTSLEKVIIDEINKVSRPTPVQKKSKDFSFAGVMVILKFPLSSVNAFANTFLSPLTNLVKSPTQTEVSFGFFLIWPIISTGSVKGLNPKKSVVKKIKVIANKSLIKLCPTATHLCNPENRFSVCPGRCQIYN